MGNTIPTQERSLARSVKSLHRRLAAALLLPTLPVDCTQIPESSVTEWQFGTLSCAELIQQTAQANATVAAADQAKSNSWHAVLRFVVAARYGQASTASSEAERRLTSLAAQSTRLGCDR